MAPQRPCHDNEGGLTAFAGDGMKYTYLSEWPWTDATHLPQA